MRTLIAAVALALAVVINSGCTAVCWKELTRYRHRFDQTHAAWLVPSAPGAAEPDLVVAYRFKNGGKDPHVVRYRAFNGSYAIDDFECRESFEPPEGATELAIRAFDDGGSRPFLEASPDQVAAVVWPGTPRRVEVVAMTGRAPAWARAGRFAALPFTIAIDVALSPVYAVALTVAGVWLLGREIRRL